MTVIVMTVIVMTVIVMTVIVMTVIVMTVIQNDTACMRLDCCRHLHKLCQYLPVTRNGGRFRFFGQPVVGPRCLASSATHKSGERRIKPWPDYKHTHTSTHSEIIWICDLCHKQINKNKPKTDAHIETNTIHSRLEMHQSHTPTQLATSTSNSSNTTTHQQ